MSIRIDDGDTWKVGSIFGNGSNSSSYGGDDFMADLTDTVKSWDTSGSNSFFGGLGALFNKAITLWDDYVGNTANRENIAYQKEYNEQVFNRADTQYQRTVADLRAAGLSSQLAAGAPSTVAGQSAAPQRAVGNESQAIERLIGMITSMKQVNASAKLASAQADKTIAETRAIENQNATFGESHALDMLLKRNQADYNSALTKLAMTENQYKASEIEANIKKALSEVNKDNQLIDLYKKQASLYEAQTLESSSKSSLYGAEKLESEMRSFNLQADTLYKQSSKSKVDQEILNLKQQEKNLKREFDNLCLQGTKLNFEGKLAAQQAATAAWNLLKSQQFGLRTNDNQSEVKLFGIGKNNLESMFNPSVIDVPQDYINLVDSWYE